MPSHHRTPLALAALLTLAPLVADAGTAPRATPQARPKSPERAQPKPGDTIDLSKLDFARQVARLPVARDPVMSTFALMALRRFAEGARSSDPVDKAVARALGRVKNGRKIAKRIVARIDALPQAKRDATFGKGDDRKRPTAELAQATTVGMVNPLYIGLGHAAIDTMWAEAVPSQSSFKIVMSGLAAPETSDGDQDGDEVVVMSTLCRVNANASDFVLEQQSAPADGALEGLTAGEVVPLARPIYDGAAFGGLLVTAAFEVDDDAAVAREEYLAMVALAKPLAVQLFQQGDTVDKKLTRFAFALDYTIGLLAAAQPDRWPQGALVKTVFSGFSDTLGSLAATAASNDGGVPWKLAHEHDLPVGKYVVYFNVPSTQPPAQKNVKLKVSRIESEQPEPGGDDLSLLLGIGQESLTKVLPKDTNVSTKSWTVQRMVNPGSIEITVELWDTDPGPTYGTVGSYGSGQYCGDWPDGKHYAPCPEFLSVLDLDDEFSGVYDPDSYVLKMVVNTNTGAITGDITGDVGDVLTLEGTTPPNGKVKVVVTVE